jgi:hypothetical protein
MSEPMGEGITPDTQVGYFSSPWFVQKIRLSNLNEPYRQMIEQHALLVAENARKKEVLERIGKTPTNDPTWLRTMANAALSNLGRK